MESAGLRSALAWRREQECLEEAIFQAKMRLGRIGRNADQAAGTDPVEGEAAGACRLNFVSGAGFCTAPMTWSTSMPSLKNTLVGIERTLSFDAVLMLLSTSSFATFARPA